MDSQENKFNEKSTALEVVEGHDLTGYEAIVTGGASGIGVETVRALAKAGARVVIATRDLAKAQEVADQLKKETGSDKIEAERLDLASIKSVREFTKAFLAKNRPLNFLVNNAGVMACPLQYTVDGFEMQFGTNHLGHFALTLDLIPALKEGAKKSGKNARVVNLSSVAHVRHGIKFDDPNFKNSEYDQWVSYGQSKTANVLFSIGLTKRFNKDGIFSNAVMPGGIMTNLQKHMSKEEQMARQWIDKDGNPNPLFKTVEQGAATTIWACVGDDLENRGGLYLQDMVVAPIVETEEAQKRFAKGDYSPAVSTHAVDEKYADQLWTLSEDSLKGLSL